uniref:RelA-associated inhibitor n=2 Tax=Pyxicephalus adspersus TaxID=30357 RepID=A0AAV3A1S9_PYXAD|nr:TPA: hypothetical protein GDO54_017128 [Pyxicephalus adspersus]
MTRRSLPSESSDPYMSSLSHSPRGRPSSPRPQYYDRPPSTSSSRLSSHDYSTGVRSASPVPEGQFPIPRYSDWAPPQRQPSAYEVPPGFAPHRFSDDVSSLRRRPPQRSWNESDLDLVYEKKPPQDRVERASLGAVPVVKTWRESSLDPAPMKGKGDVASTLPRGYKFSSADRGPQGPDPGWKSGSGTLPRSFPSQQPISRIPVPPPGRAQPHRPLPLSMIFRLQNAFWEHQIPPQINVTAPPMSTATPPPFIPVIPDIPTPTPPPPATEEVPRPLSPTRLQPQLPPQMADVQRVLEDIPRPLRRRGSQEHTSQAPPLPSDRRQYQQIMSRLFGRAAPKSAPAPEQPKAEEKLQGSNNKRSSKQEEPSAEELNYKILPIPEEPRQEEKHEGFVPKPAEDPVQIFLDTSESRVGASAQLQGEVELPVPVVISGGQSLELRPALKGRNSPRKSRPRHARLDPLILLLDGALTGELDVVTQALKEVNDPSQPNEEGITALHNAICGANFHIVNLLISSGANVNAADSHGW